MSKLFIVLFCMFMSLILLSKSAEFLMCERRIVPSRWVIILAMAGGILWVALPMLEIMGRWGGLVCGFWVGHIMLGL